jgi:hypothetical protein
LGCRRCWSAHALMVRMAGPVEPGLGQPVLVPVGVRAVADALQEPLLDQGGQASREDVAPDAEVALEEAVAVYAEERLAQYQEGPAISQHVKRALYRVWFGAGTRLVHPGELVRRLLVDRLAY